MATSIWDNRAALSDDEEIAGFDDEALEELQVLLWRGYVPEPYARKEWSIFTGGEGQWHTWISPRQQAELEAKWQDERRTAWRPPTPKPKPEPTGKTHPWITPPPDYEQFQCAHCRRWFLAAIEMVDAHEEYFATFGPDAPVNPVALCEPCFDIAMKGLQ